MRPGREFPGNATSYANCDGLQGTSDDYGLGYYPCNAQRFVENLLAAVDPYVDFSHYAENGVVSDLIVIHAGQGAETNGSCVSCIWSHRWVLHQPLLLDGVEVYDYTIQPEYIYSAGDSTIGVFAHEYGHLLGLPDLYDTDYSSYGLGEWSLMANGCWNGYPGGSRPAHPDAWTKIELGWVDPQLISTPQTVAFPAVETSPTVVKLWSGLHSNEYFLVENRQMMGFDNYLPGDGLLIYHVDEYASQNNDWHPMVMVEQEDGYWDLQFAYNSGDWSDCWPGDYGNICFDAFSTPNNLTYAGEPAASPFAISAHSAMTMTAEITPSTEGPGTISGVVHDSEGNPIADAWVFASPSDVPISPPMPPTQGAGAYSGVDGSYTTSTAWLRGTTWSACSSRAMSTSTTTACVILMARLSCP